MQVVESTRHSRDGKRIPLTIADADADKGSITLIFQTVGRTTHLLANMNEGDEIPHLLGPLGTPTHMDKIGHVVCLGGGNVAMDAARSALRLSADEVHLIYRRTEVEMPARTEERHHAKEEGIVFHVLENAKRILGDDQGCVTGIECLRYELGEPDDSGRRRPIAISDSEFVIELDTIIVAIGNDSNPLIKQTTPEIETNKWGNIVTDDTGKTSVDRIYAGGDIVLGAATVILAMGQGRAAAASINDLLTE